MPRLGHTIVGGGTGGTNIPGGGVVVVIFIGVIWVVTVFTGVICICAGVVVISVSLSIDCVCVAVFWGCIKRVALGWITMLESFNGIAVFVCCIDGGVMICNGLSCINWVVRVEAATVRDGEAVLTVAVVVCPVLRA